MIRFNFILLMIFYCCLMWLCSCTKPYIQPAPTKYWLHEVSDKYTWDYRVVQQDVRSWIVEGVWLERAKLDTVGERWNNWDPLTCPAPWPLVPSFRRERIRYQLGGYYCILKQESFTH